MDKVRITRSARHAQRLEEVMIDPKKYVVSEQAKISDIDLDVEDFQHDGERLTPKDAEAIVE
jgi:hypothetical protein